MRLCGISSHFWLLSPSIRQVTHALLTRPPLETDQICRSFNEMFPVRLACVKHAASVHPEPGSNSLIKCSLMHSRQPTSLVISRHYCLISFHSLECGSSILTNRTAIHTKFDFVSLSVHCVKNFRESYVFHCLVIKVVSLSALCDSLFRLSHPEDLVKNFFQKFFRYFQNVVPLSFSYLFQRPDYFTISSVYCQQLI